MNLGDRRKELKDLYTGEGSSDIQNELGRWSYGIKRIYTSVRDHRTYKMNFVDRCSALKDLYTGEGLSDVRNVLCVKCVELLIIEKYHSIKR